MNIENKVKVTICGKEYNLRTDETPDYLIGLAARVDKEINDMIKAKPNFGIQNAAVFVALTSLDEAKKAGDSIDNIRSQIKTYVDDAAKARSAKEKLAAEVKELKARISELEKENKELKKRPPAYDCEQLVLENTISPAVTIYAEENKPEAEIAAEAEIAQTEDSPAVSEEKCDNTEPAAENASNGTETAEEGRSDAAEDKPTECQAEQPDADRGTDAEAANDGAPAQNDDIKPENQQRNNKNNRGRKKRR